MFCAASSHFLCRPAFLLEFQGFANRCHKQKQIKPRQPLKYSPRALCVSNPYMRSNSCLVRLIYAEMCFPSSPCKGSHPLPDVATYPQGVVLLGEMSRHLGMQSHRVQELGPQSHQVGGEPGQVLTYLFCYLLRIVEHLRSRQGSELQQPSSSVLHWHSCS